MIAQAEADTDSAEAATISYEWSINGRQITTAFGSSLKMSMAKGDRVSVLITPERSGVRGVPLTQSAVIVNSPPVVRNSLVDSQASKNHFSARVEASDPDNDPLSYGIVKGPKGMKVNQQTGELAWDFQPSDTGTHELSISVKDSDNSEVILNIPLKLQSDEKTEQK